MAARKPARRPSTDRGLLPRQSSRSTRAWLRLDLFSEYAERRMDIEASQHLLGDGITVAMFGPMEPSREAHMNLLGIYLAGLILFLPGYAQATLVTYDFEDQAATSLPRTGALTSLSITHSGLTVNITREFGKHFDVVANTGGPSEASFVGPSKPRSIFRSYCWTLGRYIFGAHFQRVNRPRRLRRRLRQSYSASLRGS